MANRQLAGDPGGRLWRRAVAALALGALAGGAACARSVGPASGLPYYNSAEFTAEWPGEGGQPAARHHIAPFNLTNQLAQPVTNHTLRGHIYLANFFFADCQAVCKKMVTNLQRVQTAFANEPTVLLVSHTVNPDDDSVEALAKYAVDNAVVPGKWHLLTGPRDAIYTLARQSYFAEKSLGLAKTNDAFLHTENMLLVDKHGRLRGIYNATLPLEADRAIEDIRLLQGEE